MQRRPHLSAELDPLAGHGDDGLVAAGGMDGNAKALAHAKIAGAIHHAGLASGSYGASRHSNGAVERKQCATIGSLRMRLRRR